MIGSVSDRKTAQASSEEVKVVKAASGFERVNVDPSCWEFEAPERKSRDK